MASLRVLFQPVCLETLESRGPYYYSVRTKSLVIFQNVFQMASEAESLALPMRAAPKQLHISSEFLMIADSVAAKLYVDSLIASWTS